MENEHRITYKAGITRTPSDFLCSDGELAECINLTTDNEELKPIVQPATKFTLDSDTLTLVYIHKFGDKSRYIFLDQYQQHTYKVKWCYVESGALGTMYALKDTGGTNDLELQLDPSEAVTFNRKISSTGKVLTLIGKEAATSPVLMHFVWKGSTYSKSLVIPQQDADFRLNTGTWNGGANGNYGDALNGDYTIKDQSEWNNLLVGLYEKNVKNIETLKEFCKPFLVRTAIELYDGTYYYISQPMMMFACVRENSWARRYSGDEIGITTLSCRLEMKQKTDLSEYADFVKDVVVFVSLGVEPHEISADQTAAFTQNTSENTYADRIVYSGIGLSDEGMMYKKDIPTSNTNDILDVPLKQKTTDDIKMELESSSVFYKLCSVGLGSLTSWTDLKKYIKPYVLENLKNQDRLDVDDYFSRCSINPEFLYSYNARLNMSGVSRGFFEGFGKFLPYVSKKTGATSYTHNDHTYYDFYVSIETDEETVTVHHRETYEANEHCNYYQGIFFFYPDPRAKHVWIVDNNGSIRCNQDLKEHPGLNGAYYFKGLPGYGGEEQADGITPSKPSTYNNYATELLPNYILTTEVYNPWCITSKGYSRIDIGRILAMSTITQALSQDQKGPSPLLLFTENGIWGMSVDKTGLYEYTSSVSRDVCISPKNIIQTDNAVFFVSKKGLMVATQEGNYRNIAVKCVSERMNGVVFDITALPGFGAGGLAEGVANENSPIHPWAQMIQACSGTDTFLNYIRDEGLIMAYDYIDSRIIMANPSYGYAFAYNMADGTISKVILPAAMTNAVNNYPDYLLQGTVTEQVEGRTVTHKYIYSFYEKQREEQVTSRQLAFLLTRPMKLTGPVSQASLRQLKNVGIWYDQSSVVKTEVWLSDDLYKWYTMDSRFGAAARYFRLALYIKMLTTERISGTIITEQERRGNNMR